MTKSLKVELGSRSYDIIIGTDLIKKAGSLIAPTLKRPRVFIITDSNTAPLYLSSLEKSLSEQKIAHQNIILPAGESTKSFANLENLLDKIFEFTPDRNVTLIALGGGVIGDITGFAASILLRGVDFIQIPTTLLAQVDSSVGGKTAVNTKHGKNLIGTFYQPRLVIADISSLLSLPKRELLAGYAEAVKYGIISDYPFFVWLEEHGHKALSGDVNALAHIVHESCKTKAEIVGKDERESDLRAILNFGHTIGHALEAETGYSNKLLHGEAVAIGMLLAMRLSIIKNLSELNDYKRLKHHFSKVGIKTSLLDIDTKLDNEKLISHCYQDKKAQDGKMTFILAKGIGRTVISRDVTSEEVRQVLEL